MTGDAATLAFYQKEAPLYTVSAAQAPSRDLDPFLERLPTGANILELGCGAGRDAERMLERGFTVDATDGSAAMAKRAKERIGQPVRVMRFGELRARDTYDAIWAHASLLHADRSELPVLLQRIVAAMKPGALFYASYKLGEAQARDRFDRLYNFFDRETLMNVYRQTSRLKIDDINEYAGSGFDGMDRQWLAIVTRKDNTE